MGGVCGSKAWTLSSGDGTKTVYVQYRDAAGNASVSITGRDFARDDGADPDRFDHAGASWTGTAAVTLTLSSVGATEMRFSNGQRDVQARGKPIAPAKIYTLVAGRRDEDGLRSVRDAIRTSAVVSDTIGLDATAPAEAFRSTAARLRRLHRT